MDFQRMEYERSRARASSRDMAERKPNVHLLIGAAWDELGVDGSEDEGLGSAVMPDTSLGGGGECVGG